MGFCHSLGFRFQRLFNMFERLTLGKIFTFFKFSSFTFIYFFC